MESKERYPVNQDPKNCGDCVYLEHMKKIDQYFCKREGVNIRILKTCETGPIYEEQQENYES